MPVGRVLGIMKIKNAKAWAPSGLKPWAMTAAVLALVFALRLVLHPLLGERMALTGFVIVSMYVQFRFGLAKAIVASMIGFALGEFMFVQPYGAFDGISEKDLLMSMQFFALIVACMVIIQHLRVSQYQNRLLALVAESRYLMLLQSESEREAAEKSFKTSGVEV